VGKDLFVYYINEMVGMATAFYWVQIGGNRNGGAFTPPYTRYLLLAGEIRQVSFYM
jgi:hypothetical protein